MRERLIRILRNAGPPRRAAAAFALGVFLSFSPFLGFQTLLGFAVALTFRLSRVVMFAGLCMNLPWLMLPWYTLATVAGAVALRQPVSADLGLTLSRLFDLPLMSRVFWTQSIGLLAPFLWSFVLGSTAGALVLSAAAYAVVVRYLSRARWHDPRPPDAPVDTAPG